MINSIEKLQALNPLKTEQTVNNTSETSGDLFSSIFQSAIDYVKETDAEKTEAEYLLATGQLDNPAELTIAASKSELAVELLVQLRNKALDAYSELTRISI